MRSIITKIAAISLLTLLLSAGAFAKATLTPIPGHDFPTEVQPGHPYTFSLHYQGDPPTSLKMILQTPGGNVSVPALIPAGDASQGIDVSWTYIPENTGTYTYHFEASAGDLGSARYPAELSNDPQFVSSSIWMKYGIFLIGLIVALLFLPFVVYVAARAINKHGDPAAAARIALLIGVLASYGLFLYLFYTVYTLLMLAVAGLVALGILIALFTRRRVA